MPEALATHVLWVIEHHPDSGLEGTIPVSSSYPPSIDSNFENKRQLWLRQAAIHDRNPRVLGNEAQFLMQTDQFAAEEFFRRALQLEPQNPVWSARLRNLYIRAIYAGFYLRAGLKPFGVSTDIEPSYPAKVKDQLDRSDDANIIGTVGAALAASVVHSREVRVSQQSQVDKARRSIADYAEVLLRRAESLDPGNVQRTEPFRLMRNEPRTTATTIPALAGHQPANASEPSAQRIRVGGAAQARQLMGSVPAVYPPLARQARIQGTVRLQVVIGPEGRIITTQLVHGHPLLVPSALESVKSWVYRPTIVDGHPVEVETYVDVNFELKP